MGVQSCGEEAVTRRADDEGPFDPDIMHDDAREVAAEDHKAEGERIGRVDEVGGLFAAAAEGVHGAPDTGGEEVAEAKDEGIVEC